VNAGIPKTLVRFLVRQFATYLADPLISDCLNDILSTPISPELRTEQETEQTIGKYGINDFILHRFLICGDTEERILFLLKKTFALEETVLAGYAHNFFKRFFSQQFKRQANPDGPKILDFSLSPRGDFRMPSDVKR
ncbi:MAG TPA: NAD(+) synthase, partial [Bacillota bacterium]|nr:NAD(+) synthase [Bacillota bacterium]